MSGGTQPNRAASLAKLAGRPESMKQVTIEPRFVDPYEFPKALLLVSCHEPDPSRGNGLVKDMRDAVVCRELLDAFPDRRKCVIKASGMKLQPSEPEMIAVLETRERQCALIEGPQKLIVSKGRGPDHKSHKEDFKLCRVDVFSQLTNLTSPSCLPSIITCGCTKPHPVIVASAHRTE